MGIEGLTDRSRRPYRQANRLPIQIETLIVSLKKEQPTWGAPKIREKLRRLYPDIHLPATSTVHAVLDRNGLVKRRRKKRYKAQGTKLVGSKAPNELWCADYKGKFMLADKRYCYPLTITDHKSRYLLACESLSSTKESFAFLSLSGSSKNLAFRMLFEQIMVFHLLARMHSMVCHDCRSGGCA